MEAIVGLAVAVLFTMILVVVWSCAKVSGDNPGGKITGKKDTENNKKHL